MQITSVTITSTKIPTFRKHKMNIGTTSHQENVIVRLYTDTGLLGYGEAPHMVGHSHNGETPATVRAVLRDKIVPRILGQDPTQLEHMWQVLQQAVPCNRRAKSAIMLACCDLAGKALGTPVYNLLGGKVRDGILLSWSLPIEDFDMICAEAQTMVERGWRVLKLKTGRPNPMDDVEAVKRVRQTVGSEIHLRADANQAYDWRMAIKVINGMAEWGLEYMEQPCAYWDLEGLARVRKQVGIPIMVDETLKSYTLSEIIRHEAADYLSIYVCDPGGILNSRKMGVIAEEFHMKGYIGGALESVIGSVSGLHIAASSPAISLGCEMFSQYMLEKDISAKPLEFKDGCLMVPDGPGLGIEIDEDVVKHYEVGETEVFRL